MLLREFMKYKNISSADLGKVLDISPTQVSQYALGKTIPRPKMMMKICIVTEGKVDANDFNGTTREKVEKEILKSGKLK